MSVCEACSVLSLCSFSGEPAGIQSSIPLRHFNCIHFVCPEGRRAGREALENTPQESRVNIVLETGETLEAVPFEAGDKTHEITGWHILSDGTIITSSREKYRRSGQNVYRIQEWE